MPQALRLATNMELGQPNQLQISNTKPTSHVNAINPKRPFRQSNQRPNTSTSIRQSKQLCRNSGLTWSANHKDKCIAKGMTCNNGGLQNHFLRVCRKPKSSSTKPTRSNVLTQLRELQLISLSMRSKIQITIPNANPTMIVQMIIW